MKRKPIDRKALRPVRLWAPAITTAAGWVWICYDCMATTKKACREDFKHFGHPPGAAADQQVEFVKVTVTPVWWS